MVVAHVQRATAPLGDRWYCELSGRRVGPLALAQWLELARAEQVGPSDKIWHADFPHFAVVGLGALHAQVSEAFPTALPDEGFPEAVQADSFLEGVHADRFPDALQADGFPDALQADGFPEALQAESLPEALQAMVAAAMQQDRVSHAAGILAAKPAAPRILTPLNREPLALWSVAGLIACLLVYFTQQRFLTPVAENALTGGAPAKAAASVPRAFAATAKDGGEAAGLFDLEVCNHAAALPAYVAVAYFDAPRGDWVARGWYQAGAGACQLLLQHVPAPIYTYIETATGALPGAPGTAEFCVAKEGGFVLPQSQCDRDAVSRPRTLRAAAFHPLSLVDGKLQRLDIEP